MAEQRSDGRWQGAGGTFDTKGAAELASRRYTETSARRTKEYSDAIGGAMDAAFSGAEKAIDAIGNAIEEGRRIREYENHGGKEFEKGQKAEKKGNYDAAIDLYKQAIDKGLPQVFYDLAVCSRKAGKPDGEVFGYFIQAANNSYRGEFYSPTDDSSGDANYNLAVCCRDGIGTKKDDTQAFAYFKKSARGDFNVAVCYHNGIGVEKNTGLAVEQLKNLFNYLNGLEHYDEQKLAASWGYTSGDVLNYLAICYRDGGPGLEANGKEAIKLFKKAADYGNKEAFTNLAEMGVKYNLAAEAANKFLSLLCGVFCGFGIALSINWAYVMITGADRLPTIVSIPLMVILGIIAFKAVRARNKKITLLMLALAVLGWLHLLI